MFEISDPLRNYGRNTLFGGTDGFPSRKSTNNGLRWGPNSTSNPSVPDSFIHSNDVLFLPLPLQWQQPDILSLPITRELEHATTQQQQGGGLFDDLERHVFHDNTDDDCDENVCGRSYRSIQDVLPRDDVHEDGIATAAAVATRMDSYEISNVFDMLDNIDVEDEERMLMDSLDHDHHNHIPPDPLFPLDSDVDFDGSIHGGDARCSAKMTMDKNATAHTQFKELRLASEQHYGNNRFYIQLLLRREDFLKAHYAEDVYQCHQIAKHIVNLVCSSFPPGRFLEYNPSAGKNGNWTDLGYGHAAVQRVQACLFHLPVVSISKHFRSDLMPVPQSSSHVMDHEHLKPETRSNTVTLQTVFSKTISMGSHRDEYCPDVATSYRTSTFAPPKSRDEYYMKRDYESWSASSNAIKKKKKGLRRRGLLSSDVPSKNSRFQVSSELEKLLRSVFDRPIDDENGDGDSDEDYSVSSSSSSEDRRPTQRRRSMATSHSMCSSTSSLAGLGGDFSNALKLDSWQKGGKVPRRRKNASARGAVKTEKESGCIRPEVYSDFKVKIVDDGSGSVMYRSLSSYDILCNLDACPKIMLCNHVGNNRFRIMLKMYQSKFNAQGALLGDKNRLVHDIIQNTLYSEKGHSSYVFQDPDDVNIWVQIPFAFVPKLIVSCFEDCCHCPELPMLPSIYKKPFIKSRMGDHVGRRQQTMEDLHSTALRNIRKRKHKKPISGRDTGSIAMLQNSVLMNNVVHEETAIQ